MDRIVGAPICVPVPVLVEHLVREDDPHGYEPEPENAAPAIPVLAMGGTSWR